MPDKDFYISEELLIVRHSGETPEIAYHGSLYFLREDPEGPSVRLEEADLAELKQMVVERYCEIIQRDLEPDNRDKTLYRGLARCLANWQRLEIFCTREEIAFAEIREKVADLLLTFLENEVKEVCCGQRCSSINCTDSELENLCDRLNISCANLPAGWRKICAVAE